MSGHDKNEELRERDEAQDEQRQQVRDEAFDLTGEADDLGSQDERRKQGDQDH